MLIAIILMMMLLPTVVVASPFGGLSLEEKKAIVNFFDGPIPKRQEVEMAVNVDHDLEYPKIYHRAKRQTIPLPTIIIEKSYGENNINALNKKKTRLKKKQGRKFHSLGTQSKVENSKLREKTGQSTVKSHGSTISPMSSSLTISSSNFDQSLPTMVIEKIYGENNINASNKKKTRLKKKHGRKFHSLGTQSKVENSKLREKTGQSTVKSNGSTNSPMSSSLTTSPSNFDQSLPTMIIEKIYGENNINASNKKKTGLKKKHGRKFHSLGTQSKVENSKQREKTGQSTVKSHGSTNSPMSSSLTISSSNFDQSLPTMIIEKIYGENNINASNKTRLKKKHGRKFHSLGTQSKVEDSKLREKTGQSTVKSHGSTHSPMSSSLTTSSSGLKNGNILKKKRPLVTRLPAVTSEIEPVDESSKDRNFQAKLIHVRKGPRRSNIKSTATCLTTKICETTEYPYTTNESTCDSTGEPCRKIEKLCGTTKDPCTTEDPCTTGDTCTTNEKTCETTGEPCRTTEKVCETNKDPTYDQEEEHIVTRDELRLLFHEIGIDE